MALSGMIGNELVMPYLLRRQAGAQREMGPLVVFVRRAAVVIILMAGYAYERIISGYLPLASIGMISFCAVANFAPGLVLGRIACQLVNEAAFAVAEGIGSAEDVDVAMRHGYNWPRGPLEWGDEIELDHVLATLDALHEELGEERYRAAPLLRHMVAEGRIGRSVGEGFFVYDD